MLLADTLDTNAQLLLDGGFVLLNPKTVCFEMQECRSASDQCSNSHRICGVAAPMCTDEASCTAAQTACTLSIGVTARLCAPELQ